MAIPNFKKMSYRDLQKYIKEAVAESNQHIADYRAGSKQSKLFDKAVANIQKKFGSGRGGGLNKGYNLRTKDALRSYAEELSKFTDWDRYSPQGIRKENKRKRQAARTFADRHPGYTEKDFENLGKALDNLPEDLLTDFASGVAHIINEYQSSGIQGKTIGKIFTDVYEKEKSKGLTEEDLYDAVREALDERKANNEVIRRKRAEGKKVAHSDRRSKKAKKGKKK